MRLLAPAVTLALFALANAAHASWNCGYPNAAADLADLVEGFGGAPLMDVIRMSGEAAASGQEAVA